MGRKVRALRQKAGLTQAALAERLEVSASYLNLIEHDRRALPAALLIRLAQILDLDLKAIGGGEDSKVAGDLLEVFADPLFEESKPAEEEVRELAAAHPGISRAVVQLHHAYTSSHASAQTLALYASWQPGGALFVDTVLGWQRLDFDLRRRVTLTGNMVEGQRDGSQWFGSVAVGADLNRGAWRFSPYGRLDMSSGTLDGYTETGDPIFGLTFRDQDVDSSTGNLGLRVEYSHEASWGVFMPQFRAEFQHDFSGTGDALMQYSDWLTGPVYRATLAERERNRFVLGLGSAFRFEGGWSLRVDFRSDVSDDQGKDNSVQVGVDKQF